jgi:site-specific DNA recombinase
MHKIIEKLDKLDVSFVSINETFDTSTSLGRLMFNILSSFAEFESDAIGERAYMGMLGNARQGNYNGGTVPDGYKVSEGKLVIDKDRARIVRLIFDLYYYGDPETKREMGTRAIAEWLNKRGYRTKQHITKTGKILGGKQWSREGIRGILTNPVYYGAYTWNKYRIKRTDAGVITKKRDPKDWIVVENDHDAIISKDMFLAVNEKLKSNQKVNVRGRQENYLFSGLLHFVPCGIKLEGWKKERGKYVDRYYRCNPAVWKRIRGLSKDEVLTPYCKDCNAKSVRQDIIEPFLLEQIKGLKDRLPEIHELVAKVKQQAVGQTEKWVEQEKSLTKEKDMLEWEKKSLYESLRMDEISPKELGERLKQIAKRENELEDKLSVIRARSKESIYIDQNTELAKNLIMRFADAVNHANEHEKKSLIQAIVKRVDISKSGKVDIIFRLPIKNIGGSIGMVSPRAA